MSNRRPAKLLPVKFNLRTALPPDPAGRTYQYNAQLTMANPQRHSSNIHGNKQYTLEDLLVGDYVSTTGNGRIMKIVSLTTVTPYDAIVVVEDEYRLNQIQDSSGDSIPWIESQNGVVFEVREGKPVLFPYTEYSTAVIGFVRDYAAELFSRFNYLRQHTLVDVYQAGHSFVQGDLLTWTPTNGWSLMQENDNYLGIVVEYNEPFAGWFRFRPNGEVLDLELPGTGPLFYWDPANPGKLTESTPLPGERYVLAFYKLSDRQAIFFTNNPAISLGAQFVTLGTTQTITGDKNFTGAVTFAQSPSFTSLDVQTARVRDLTNNRIVIAGTSGLLEDDANLTFNGTELNIGQGKATITVSSGDITTDGSVIVGTDLTVEGDFVVNGTTTTVNTANTTITDQLIELNQGYSGPPMTADSGIVINRGPEDNVFFGWDEDVNRFTVGTGAFTGASTGQLTLNDADVRFASVQSTTLTENRIVIVGADGVLEDDTNLTWDGNELNVTGTGVAFTTGTVNVGTSTDANINHTMYVLYNTTSSTTQTRLFLNGSAGNISIPVNSTVLFEADIVGRDTTGAQHCSFKLTGVLNNTAGSTVLVNNVSETIIAETDETWVAVAQADNSTDSLAIRVTGSAGDSIKRVVFVKTTRISF